MTAKRSPFVPEVRIFCDTCRAKGYAQTATVEEARLAANEEAGWTNDGARDFCPTCTVRQLTASR